tara:strand:+ start:332 stop:517 length:186 start_codon:yes stop_codon:yes gene_type:complete
MQVLFQELYRMDLAALLHLAHARSTGRDGAESAHLEVLLSGEGRRKVRNLRDYAAAVVTGT